MITPTAQTQVPYLKDDCDRASEIINCDINKTVFGDLNAEPAPVQSAPAKASDKNKKPCSFLGALLLGALSALGIFTLNKTGKIKLPKININA